MTDAGAGTRAADAVASVDVDGAALEVHRYDGAPGRTGPTLVFLHEGLGSAAMWRDFPGRVAAATGLPAVVYSRRGYGASAPRARPYTVDFMHEEAYRTLPALLGALGVDKPFLIGHSDGGSIALIHATEFPVAGLIVEAPHVFVEQICVNAIAEARAAFATTDLKDRLGRYHADPEHAFRGWNDIWLKPAFRAWDIRPLLSLVSCPVLAIQGEADQYGTMAQIDGIAAAASGAVRLLKLVACGHSPHRDQAERVLGAMTGFIVEVTQVATSDTAPRGRYIDDYADGEVIVSRAYTLSRREILAFARAYDPQPMHIDEVFARTDGPFEDIIASGFQTLALAFKLFAEAGYFEGDVALGGPGTDEVRWLAPVYPGDVLTNHVTVAEARRSKSRPDRGILRLAHEVRNQRGVTVMTCLTASMIKARPA